MGLLEDKFSESLRAWKTKNFKGTQKELGAMFGVSQGQINNVLNKTRCGSETWRRMVAKKIGIPYDQMIGMATQSLGMDIAVVTESDITTERHRRTIDEFQNKKLALKINKELVALEKLDRSQLEKMLEIIQDRKFRLEQEALKRNPPPTKKN